jgi:hypothetical protein
MRLVARIQKLEVVAAPIKAEQQRRRENRRLREEIFKALKDHIENLLALYRYVFGDDLNEEEKAKDIIEMDLLFEHEAGERFGVDEKGFFKATQEQLQEVSREVTMRSDRHLYGNDQTAEEFDKEQEQWNRVREDMAAGVASADSEAAEYIRQLFKRYPRRMDAERFYDIWD